jgi:hypothetical protein
MLASAAVSYGVQTLFSSMAASAVESQARQGVEQMVTAAQAFRRMVEEFHRWQAAGTNVREATETGRLLTGPLPGDTEELPPVPVVDTRAVDQPVTHPPPP